ncbi:hypothetical protein [Bacillus sp. YKCMOAS1]|uniref:hypothetical protein n=1 Tax=Bacillus sp. YKCMOAS1 TaxID=2925778 RepID=UPI00253BEB3B|nr:hypothetical protein [Bacillus sp. YKCMOAS1]GLJ04288.1 hypothetical protein OAS1_35350 [Bacillus sp. YKCMOAS1]
MVEVDDCIDINNRINEFKEYLNDDANSTQEIIDKYLVFGTPHIYSNQEVLYYNLKQKVASFFNVNQRDIFMIGSSKLGFSISPSKLWRHIDGDPKKDSDIDLVIISDVIFDKYWKSIFSFIEKTIPTSNIDENHVKFLEYFFKGWLRPDKFPHKYEGSDEWFEFFREISYKEEFGSRKIAAAIYRDEYFFNAYNTKNIDGIRTNLKNREGL